MKRSKTQAWLTSAIFWCKQTLFWSTSETKILVFGWLDILLWNIKLLCNTCNIQQFVRFEVLAAVTLKSTVCLTVWREPSTLEKCWALSKSMVLQPRKIFSSFNNLTFHLLMYRHAIFPKCHRCDILGFRN